MRSTRTAVVVVALVVPAVAGWLLQNAPVAAEVERARPRVVDQAATAPHVLGVAVGVAYAEHTRLMAAANALKVSTVLPEPIPHSAGVDARDIERQEPVAKLPEIPDGRKIAIFFTGNVVGETDPCG